MLSLLLDEEVVSMDTVLLEALADGGGRQRLRVLRAAWPVDQLEFHHRDDVRVATPDLPPLGASLILEGQRYPAKLLNLTETGMGLGLHQGLPFQPRGEVMVETLLPGGSALQLVGEVRHWERLEDDPLPVRLGLVLKHLPDEVREQLRRMIQARRIIRSEAIRGE
jgi:c-di-GMP-binding flagellar brake protein YcgR